MNFAYLHLIINHIPIVGLAAVLITFFFALLKKNNQMLNFSMFMLVVLAVLAIPLGESGEAAEEVVERTTTVNETFIEAHEEAAEWATPLMYVTGALAFVGFIINRNRGSLPVLIKGLLIFFMLMTQVAMIRTGYLGGKIRRPELQNATGAANAVAAEEEEEED